VSGISVRLCQTVGGNVRIQSAKRSDGPSSGGRVAVAIRVSNAVVARNGSALEAGSEQRRHPGFQLADKVTPVPGRAPVNGELTPLNPMRRWHAGPSASSTVWPAAFSRARDLRNNLSCATSGSGCASCQVLRWTACLSPVGRRYLAVRADDSRFTEPLGIAGLALVDGASRWL
jgi:hypothetical protein